MKLPSTARFADEKLKEAYYKLENGDDSERWLFKVIKQAMDNIEENAFCGDQMQKKLIPKVYVQKYRIENLWVYDLPKGWRLLYSVAGKEVIVVSIIVEWMDHKDYERRFNY